MMACGEDLNCCWVVLMGFECWHNSVILADTVLVGMDLKAVCIFIGKDRYATFGCDDGGIGGGDGSVVCVGQECNGSEW